MATIRIDDLYKEFPVSNGVEVAVDEVNLTIEDGNFVSLVGPSGCGKTTTLRCVAGLETPTSGEIYISNDKITNQPPQQRRLSMVFQDIALYPHMSVRENIEYPLKLNGVSKETRNEKSDRVSEILQIGQYIDKNPSELSGGQAQRVAIARAIVRDPAAFLLDEPMSDLDAKLKMEMRKELGKIHREVNATMLYVTHDQEEAMTLSDKIAVMNNGHIEQFGAPENVYRDPVNIFVAQFIGSPSINLVKGTIKESNSSEVTVELSSGDVISFRPDSGSEEDGSTDITLGFRPKHTKVVEGAGNGIQGTVVMNETIGDDIIQYINTSFGEVRAVVPLEEAIEEEKDVSLQLQTSGIYIFDGKTGKKVIRGDQETRKIAI